MPMNSLHDLYHDQLQDLHSACNQALKVTRDLGGAATDETLTKALTDGGQGIADGIEKLKSLCDRHDISPGGEHCKGMEGLVAEARAHVLDETFADDAVRDAAIIAQYQRLVHYALAGYGCLAAFATRLELEDDAAMLKAMLDSTYDGDRRMTEIAVEGGVNEAAA